MSFKGTFRWIKSLNQGGRKAISFTLKNDNLIKTETIDAAIVDGSNIVPTRRFYGLKLKAGQSATFDIDNNSWDWAQGDFFAILDSKGQIAQKWDLNLPMMAPGECKECHGTHKCSACGGQGKILNRNIHIYEMCTVCHGTGICQTCFIPTRQNSPHSPIYSPVAPQQPLGGGMNSLKYDKIRAQIRDLEHKVYMLEQENLNIQRHNNVATMHSVYLSNSQLKTKYELEIIRLQSMLNSL